MRRAVLALGGTVAGLAALFSYKTHVPTVTALSTPVTPLASPSATPTPTMKPPTTKPSATKSAKAKPTATKTTAPAYTPPPTHTAPAKPSGTFTGPQVDTNYGPVQVQITVSNGKITAANGQDDGGSWVGENAIPQLNQEAVQAQSANIQGVSGATYTSEGYAQSLQQAIDAAHL